MKRIAFAFVMLRAKEKDTKEKDTKEKGTGIFKGEVKLACPLLCSFNGVNKNLCSLGELEM
jgi:hypothetical protein